MSDKILDLKLTYRCNNNCEYCCQDRKLRMIQSELPLDRIVNILECEKGIEKVVLTGGEPTMSANFFEIVKLIKSSGINNIQLQTNARKLRNSEYLEKIVRCGINSFGISLHGCTERMHEAFSSTKGSFSDVIYALENLKKYKFPIALNCVVTKHNIFFMDEIVRFVEQKRYASSIQFAFIHMTGKAENGIENFVRISEVAENVKKVIQDFSNSEIKIFTEAIPFCLMEGFEKNVSELSSYREVITYDFRERREFNKLALEKFKAKGPKCHMCLFNSICDGTWAEYPELCGFDEFIPITSFRSEY